jgi:DNA-binding transcriptional MerR regulator
VHGVAFVTSGQAARELGVSLRSLQQWVREGRVAPDYFTPGGHARWDVDRVRRELRERIARRDDE